MALVYRAYYALIRSPRITSTGKNTNAQFGFTTTLLDLIQKEKPTHLAVVFDTHAPTERHIDFTAYKANRQETPEDILSAIPDIKRIVKGFNLPCLELDGFEADDIIGSLAKETAALGYTVYMVTPDKDYGQVVGDSIFIYKPGYQGGKAEILGAKEVCEKWGIQRTDQVIDILGLNHISKTIYDNAVAAMAGLVNHGHELTVPPAGSKYVAVTMLGNTTTAVMALQKELEKSGFEVVTFHANGVGGPAMEELAEAGQFAGVIDFTPSEIVGFLVGGIHYGGDRRMKRVGAIGIPQILVPACVDFSVHHTTSISDEFRIKCKPSLNHCTTAPPINTLPSNA